MYVQMNQMQLITVRKVNDNASSAKLTHCILINFNILVPVTKFKEKINYQTNYLCKQYLLLSR